MIPRKEAEEFYEIIEGALKKADPERECTECSLFCPGKA